MNRGDVWWVEEPEAGRRPHLVITRQAAIPRLNVVLAVPATRRTRGIPSEVPLDADDGMPTACVLTLDSLALVRKAFFVEWITTLRPEKMHAVCAALRVATDC